MNLVDDIHETVTEGHLISLDTILHDALSEHQEYSRIISPDEFVTQTSLAPREDSFRYLNVIDNTASNVIPKIDENGSSTSTQLSGIECSSSALSFGQDLENDAAPNLNPVFNIPGGITYQEVPIVLHTSSQTQPVLKGNLNYSL